MIDMSKIRQWSQPLSQEYAAALALVRSEGYVGVHLLQQRLGYGTIKCLLIIEKMEETGFVEREPGSAICWLAADLRSAPVASPAPQWVFHPPSSFPEVFDAIPQSPPSPSSPAPSLPEAPAPPAAAALAEPSDLPADSIEALLVRHPQTLNRSLFAQQVEAAMRSFGPGAGCAAAITELY